MESWQLPFKSTFDYFHIKGVFPVHPFKQQVSLRISQLAIWNFHITLCLFLGKKKKCLPPEVGRGRGDGTKEKSLFAGKRGKS